MTTPPTADASRLSCKASLCGVNNFNGNRRAITKRPGRVKCEVRVQTPKPRGYEFQASDEFKRRERDLVLAVGVEVEVEVEGNDVAAVH